MADTPARYVVETLRMTAGMLIWAVHLGIVYAVVGLACARGHPGSMALFVGIATVAALAAAAVSLGYAVRDLRRRRDASFRSGIAALVAGGAIIAIAWDGLPALIVPACPS